MTPSIFKVDPTFGETRIFRQVTFDGETFDALMDLKRALNDYHSTKLTNSEVLRVVILSQPDISAVTQI